MKKKFYIGGKWVEAIEYAELKSPYTNEVIAQIPQATPEQVSEAIESAYNMNEAMASLTALERSTILQQITDLLRKERLAAAKIIATEAAKPLKFAFSEVDRTIETFQFAAEEAKRIHGEMIPLDAAKNGANRIGYTIREPIGVVAAITPFNFPLNLVAHKVGPAIASGNTVVLKPASQTPLSALFLAKLIEQTDLPKGAFNVVTGSGKKIGDQLVMSDKVSMVTFTGSPEVGIGIRNKAGLKKVALELGSNAGLIVDNGVDLEKIVPSCVTGSFSNQGQVCISLQRIYVMQESYEEFLSLFKEQTEKLVMGDPLDEKTDIASLISPKETDRALNWIEEAISLKANIVSGGTLTETMLKPTILSNVNRDAKVSRQEVFAPIVTVTSINSIEEGINAINDSNYGLQAGIFTRNIETAFLATKKLQVGGVIINDIPTYRVDQMPYGGVKQSGNAREGIKYTIEEMTEMKLVVWNNN